MTTAYGPADCPEVVVSLADGTRHRHTDLPHVRGRDGMEKVELSCSDCAERLLAIDGVRDDKPHGWATTPEQAPLTLDQAAAREAAQQNALAAVIEDPQGYTEFVRNRRRGAARGGRIPVDLPERA